MFSFVFDVIPTIVSFFYYYHRDFTKQSSPWMFKTVQICIRTTFKDDFKTVVNIPSALILVVTKKLNKKFSMKYIFQINTILKFS